jgi:hypothetical protein
MEVEADGVKETQSVNMGPAKKSTEQDAGELTSASRTEMKDWSPLSCSSGAKRLGSWTFQDSF